MNAPPDPPSIDPDALAHLQAAAAGVWPCPRWCVSAHDHEAPEVRTHRSQTRQIGEGTGVLVLVIQTDYGNGMLHPPRVNVIDGTLRAQDGSFPYAEFAPAEALLMAAVLDKLDGARPTLHTDLVDALREAATLAADEEGRR
ncbi:hypothetical protein PS9374_04648 [Planomonospora sphaerica]|uniref:Uncharacterized protein n=1 Tax=Planomonospora sphaerica TaxID=161355 RepID=A0A161MCL0_9ACTN|nr:hypothetical protein [Planomonospora sphaerica]GAT68983.1 hypothetical protein PS9374_04648 [Planomonospora sphaerica]